MYVRRRELFVMLALICYINDVHVIYYSDKPDVTIGPEDPYVILEGDIVIIKCTVADANPAATDFRYKQLNSWSSWSDSNTKGYTNTDRTNAGEYSCRAKNYVGSGAEDALQLLVHCEFILCLI